MSLVRTIIATKLYTNTTKNILNTDSALIFLLNKKKLAEKRKQFFAGIDSLDSSLHHINELPREKSGEIY